jgi:NADPH:quinone reductase-like Zn-dependent oxidoreductase
MITQLARHAVGPSGRIVALCSDRNAEMVKSLGADEVRDLGLLEPVPKLHLYQRSCYARSLAEVKGIG